jgi:hypothetical protein
MEAHDLLPAHVDQVRVESAADGTTLRGIATTNAAPAGTRVRLTWTVYGTSGASATAISDVALAANGQTTAFIARVAGLQEPVSYTYTYAIAE